MDTASRISTAKDYLRRKYAVDPAGLRALMDNVAVEATDDVIITGQSFEGGSHTGQLTFERMAYLRAIMDVLDEVDPDNAPTREPTIQHADFSGSYITT